VRSILRKIICDFNRQWGGCKFKPHPPKIVLIPLLYIVLKKLKFILFGTTQEHCGCSWFRSIKSFSRRGNRFPAKKISIILIAALVYRYQRAGATVNLKTNLFSTYKKGGEERSNSRRCRKENGRESLTGSCSRAEQEREKARESTAAAFSNLRLLTNFA